MSGEAVTVVLLPGVATDGAALAVTVASVRDEVGPDARVVHCPAVADAPPAWPGVEAVTPADVAATEGLVAFARAGDRWRPGTWVPRCRPLLAHPTAVLAVAGHLRTADGTTPLPVAAPLPPVDPGALLLRPCIEASSVVVRSSVLDVAAVELLHRPHGDALVWSRLIAGHGFLPSGEQAAEVPIDPERHGFLAPARTAALLAETTVDDGDDEPPGRSAARRELLRRWYVEGDRGTEIEPTSWLGRGASTPRGQAVVEDLMWALGRQREALAAERVAWLPESLGDGGPVDRGLDLEPLRHGVELERLHREIQVRDETVNWLHREVAARDATIHRLQEDAARRDDALVRLQSALDAHEPATADRPSEESV